MTGTIPQGTIELQAIRLPHGSVLLDWKFDFSCLPSDVSIWRTDDLRVPWQFVDSIAPRSAEEPLENGSGTNYYKIEASWGSDDDILTVSRIAKASSMINSFEVYPYHGMTQYTWVWAVHPMVSRLEDRISMSLHWGGTTIDPWMLVMAGIPVQESGIYVYEDFESQPSGYFQLSLLDSVSGEAESLMVKSDIDHPGEPWVEVDSIRGWLEQFTEGPGAKILGRGEVTLRSQNTKIIQGYNWMRCVDNGTAEVTGDGDQSLWCQPVGHDPTYPDPRYWLTDELPAMPTQRLMYLFWGVTSWTQRLYAQVTAWTPTEPTPTTNSTFLPLIHTNQAPQLPMPLTAR